MKKILLTLILAAGILTGCNGMDQHGIKLNGHTETEMPNSVTETVTQQQNNLSHNTAGKGYGPQSPRDIDSRQGMNPVIFSDAPDRSQMNLCNIHFHKNAEHKGGEFTDYAGPGDGHGYNSGYRYTGLFSKEELKPLDHDACASEHGGLQPGDTIEVHYVHSTARVKPGPSLAACMSESIKNPQLRVEAQVYALVNDPKARDFSELTAVSKQQGYFQATGIPEDTGTPVQYAGSTTGPAYNEKGSPYQVTWSVRPKVAKVNIQSVDRWCKENPFNEDHAHGVRNLVTDPALLSRIPQ